MESNKMKLLIDKVEVEEVISEAFNIVSYGIEKKGLEITETRKELGLLKTNAQTIEKYAREKYLMKKDNEDLFIVTPDSVTK